MATQSDPTEERYPSYKERQIEDERVFLSDAMKRLYWPLDGVYPSAISVLKPLDARDRLASRDELDQREPFFRPDTNSWHEIASLPLTEPKVSLIEFSMRDLDQWEWNWLRMHSDHASASCAEFVTYGDLSDDVRPFRMDGAEDGNWEEDSDTEFVIKCCGKDRPMGKRGRKVQVTPAAGHAFVSIRDYISTVHPWLMASREDIIRANSVDIEKLSGPAGAEYMVVNTSTTECEIRLKDGWVKNYLPPRMDPEYLAKFMQRIGGRSRKMTE